jgi:hypothetical protein
MKNPTDTQKRSWSAPTLTVLGDLQTITENGGVVVPDGGGNNMS